MRHETSFLILAGVVLTSALITASSFAQTDPAGAMRQPELPPPAPMTQIEPKTENGITYLCGGVGENEVQAMKQAARDYDLMLTFAASNGAYLADVNVDIADARGRPLLQAKCDAPIMLVDFEQAGSYRVRAEASGHTVTRNVQARTGGKVQSVAMAWPMQSINMTSTTSGNQSSGGTGVTHGDAAGSSTNAR